MIVSRSPRRFRGFGLTATISNDESGLVEGRTVTVERDAAGFVTKVIRPFQGLPSWVLGVSGAVIAGGAWLAFKKLSRRSRRRSRR